jgi:sulfate adenylyltransferase large subunit
MDLLRFITAGNVDDGKSTLIGRLLHDTKMIMEDQLAALKEASERRGDTGLNLALLTDGLRAEREQGITIDVAYRYFSTPKRKFVIADCPGHFQYTRNMVTGASSANLAVLLVDAKQGLQEQTRRHSLIVSLLRIPHLVICVNKMDLVGFSQQAFEDVRQSFKEFSKKLEIQDVTFIPTSALLGDNIVDPSANFPWYNGRSLLQHLEEVHIASDVNYIDFRFPVQSVLAPEGGGEYRGYTGIAASGAIRVGEPVTVLPSGFGSRIKSIEVSGRQVSEVSAPLSATIQLEDDIDVSRGDLICRPNNLSSVSQDLDAMLFWMDDQPFVAGRRYWLRHTTAEAMVSLKELVYKMDVSTLGRKSGEDGLKLNDLARVKLRASRPLMLDAYRANRATGSFILVDEATGSTVAAGMIT